MKIVADLVFEVVPDASRGSRPTPVTGRVRADGSEVVGVKSGGLDNSQMRTSTSLEPPTYEEIASKLAAQVRVALPPPAKPAAP